MSGPQVLALNTMAMGDSLSVEVGQAAHYAILRQHCGALLPGEALVYRQPIPKGDTIELLAIDDHVCFQKVLHKNLVKAPALRDTVIFSNATKSYKHVGLVLNDSKKRRNLTQGTVLGAEIDGVKGVVGPPRDRTLALSLVSAAVAKRGVLFDAVVLQSGRRSWGSALEGFGLRVLYKEFVVVSEASVAAFEDRCTPSVDRVFERGPEVGLSTAVFSEELPFGLSSRLGAGSAAAARGYVPRMPWAAREYTAKRFNVDCGLNFLRQEPGDEPYAPREWHEDPEWISELCRSLRFRDNVADPPSRGKDVAPPSREMARWLIELLKGDTRRFETVVESARVPRNPARWLRFLLLLAGDIERNPGPLLSKPQPRGPLNLEDGFAASTAHKMTKSFRAFLVWLQNEAQCNSEAVFSSAEATAMALRGYGLHLYETG
ncbi:unnamed protein product, partial [Symbiodinium necroappetens]